MAAARLPARLAAIAVNSRSPRRPVRPAAVANRSGSGTARFLAAPVTRRGTAALLLGLTLSVGDRRAFASAGTRAAMASSSAEDKKATIAGLLAEVKWPDAFPFKPLDFRRMDDTPDSAFYESPRFVTHIDDAAISALTAFYASVFPPSGTKDAALLDICSSWISHYPKGYTAGRIAGLGMNDAELKKNPALTDYVVRDLNVLPSLAGFADSSFDVVTNAVSVDYLTKPLEIFKETNRVLKPGGVAIMSFSNRCFATKAVNIWTNTNDLDHIVIVGSYFRYTDGWDPAEARDISPNPGQSDPMYVVYARKSTA